MTFPPNDPEASASNDLALKNALEKLSQSASGQSKRSQEKPGQSRIVQHKSVQHKNSPDQSGLGKSGPAASAPTKSGPTKSDQNNERDDQDLEGQIEAIKEKVEQIKSIEDAQPLGKDKLVAKETLVEAADSDVSAPVAASVNDPVQRLASENPADQAQVIRKIHAKRLTVEDVASAENSSEAANKSASKGDEPDGDQSALGRVSDLLSVLSLESPGGVPAPEPTVPPALDVPAFEPPVFEPDEAGQQRATQPTVAQKTIDSRADYRDLTVAISPTESVFMQPQTPQTKGWFGKLPKLVRNVAWAAVFGATALTAAGLGTLAVLTFPLPRQISGETVAPQIGDFWRSGFRYQVSRPVNILVMGLDEARDVEGAQPGDLVGRTDTMLLVRVDPEEKSVNVMSIPRDTRVEIPGFGVDKINQANFEGGAELAAKTVMHNFNNVEIDRYVRVSTVAFKEIVDLVGGVEVLVPKEMKYEDKTQGLVIDLSPGLQNLNGDEAEQFARFRQDSYGDIGRVQRQQILLKALRQRMMNPTVLPKLPQIMRLLQRYIDTNLSLEELLALAGFGLNLDAKDLHMVMLPGAFSDPEEYGASYWLADYTASSDIMRTYFNAQQAELVADASVGVNYFDAPADWAVEGLQIAVQNATDDQYASYSMAEYLRDQGFYNVYVVRDWSDVNRKTSIVAQRGDLGSAKSVKSMISLGQVVSDSTGDIDSDITIRVGEDWLMQVDPTWQRLPYDGPR